MRFGHIFGEEILLWFYLFLKIEEQRSMSEMESWFSFVVFFSMHFHMSKLDEWPFEFKKNVSLFLEMQCHSPSCHDVSFFSHFFYFFLCNAMCLQLIIYYLLLVIVVVVVILNTMLSV